MKEYVEREEALKWFFDWKSGRIEANTYNDMLKSIPTADVVGRGAFEQIKWERDIAFEQLESYGVAFGEEADLQRVVRCKDCVLHYNCVTEESFRFSGIENPYCCAGKRKGKT